MIPSDPELRKQMIERMLAVVSDNDDDLSQWESNFIESITEQFKSKGNLSPRQCEILEKIHDKL